MSFIKRLFGSGESPAHGAKPDLNGIWYFVKVHKCGAIARVRIDRNNDLSLDDDAETYVVRKQVVDNVCYGMAELEVHFDSSRNETNRHVENGEFVTREEWDSQEKLRIAPHNNE